MDFKEHSCLIQERNFRAEFQIKEFKESSNLDEKNIFLYSDWRNMGVRIGIRSKGKLQDDENYVMFSIMNIGPRHTIRTLKCTCTLNILDVEKEKKLPRTFTTFLRIGNSNKYLKYTERYIERSFILNNAFDYLQKDTLIVIVEGTLEEWKESEESLTISWNPENYESSFKINQRPNLKVYLLKYSLHAEFLMQYSSVFRVMWDSSMQESTENCVLLRNEELPAFLCMLFFIETKKLIFCEVSIFDLYKIAHMYDILSLLKECREYIEKYLSQTVSYILNFTVCYSDKELKRPTEIYSQTTQEAYPNLETGNNLADPFVCNTTTSSNLPLINTKRQFKKYLKYLREIIKKICRRNSLTSYWTSQKNASNFKTEINGQTLEVYLCKNSEHAHFLIKYSSVFHELWSAPMPESAEKFFRLRNEELRAFLCMLCFIETRKLIFHEVTVFDLYKIAHQYDVPILLEECRQLMKKISLKTVSDILNFARFYDDKYLERAAEFHLKRLFQETQDDNPNFEVDNGLDDYFVCDTCPVSSSLIESVFDFWRYMKKLLEKAKNISQINYFQVISHFEIPDAEADSTSYDFYN